jgi:D-threo-aldose 1-dehydrogenase
MLETVELPGSGRRTTRLGFGCSGMMGGLSERESLRLLETAFDAGIRHFDVAPSYGHGMAERCLGKFLLGKGDQVTVATKYGILPPQQTDLLGVARNVVRPVTRLLPALRTRVARAAAGLKTKARFSAEEATRSLEISLRELGLDRIDLWLLHEATADDLENSDLLPWLQQMQQQHRIGMHGIGGERSHLDALWQRHRDYCQVMQFQQSTSDTSAKFPGAFSIHFRTVAGTVAAIEQSFALDPTACRRWSAEVDANLDDTKTLAALLLTTAMLSNLDGIVLFSSRNPIHIQTNVRMASDPAWAARSRRFLKLLQRQPVLAR